MQRFFLPFLLLLTLGVSSCEDELSTIGAPYFTDTIAVVTRRDTIATNTPGVSLSSYTLQNIPSTGTAFNSMTGATTIFAGKAENGAVEAWAALKFPVLQSDTLSKVTAVRLNLKVIPFKHGEQSDNADLTVRLEEAGKITESLTGLELADLSAGEFGRFQGAIIDTSNHMVSIQLDTSIISRLGAGSLSFVIVPGAMNNIRTFGSIEAGDAKFHPQLEYTFTNNGETKITYRKPTLDLTVVKRTRTATTDQLFIAGGTNDRVFVQLNPDSLGIDRFSSINNAILRLKLDPSQSSINQNVRDTIGPAIVLKGMSGQGDTLSSIISYGVKAGANSDIYEFQIRDILEYWLARPTENFGFELRGGYVARRVGGSLIFTEDYSMNRWTFYGPGSAIGNRPELVITSSSLQ
jgi:hypothetical protein